VTDESKERNWSDESTRFAEVRERLSEFNQARCWEPFHTPKDLAMCLAAEAGELLEPFLWKREGERVDLDKVREELADVVICAVNLALKLEIDVLAAVDAKIVRNASRYPVALARGRADKYDALEP
jgi:dCTP diphosphatase